MRCGLKLEKLELFFCWYCRMENMAGHKLFSDTTPEMEERIKASFNPEI